MISLLPAELRRQTGRRGSFWGSLGFTFLFAVILVIWAATTSGNPSKSEIINNGAGLIAAIVVICSVVVGAIAGAYDTDQGTMRYLVLTGRPRWQLVAVRYLGLFLSVIIFSLPALLLTLVAALLFGSSSGAVSGSDPTGGEAVFELFYATWMSGWLFGLLALSIGTFLKSNAVAIAVSIVLNFAGLLAAGLLWHFVSHELGDAFYPIVASAVVAREAQGAGDDPSLYSFGLAGQIAILGIWVAALVGAAIARVQRSEY